MARVRNKEYNTVHHLTSRIAHRAFFLKEDERNDFIDLMLRVSAFSGVELLGWCVLDNHFHICVYLPVPPSLTDEEILSRFRLLRGDASRLLTDESDNRIENPFDQTGARCLTPCASFDGGRAEARRKLIKSIRRRMYSIAEYMRMIKKWFSDAYNERSGHKGTMWEAVYGDRSFFMPEEDEAFDSLRDILAYIHLNPIRAALADKFDGYSWSSYAAYRHGDEVAVAAMIRAYPGYSGDEIVEVHESRMVRLLEAWKAKRAKEIARKRLAGYELPADSLTDECKIAQEKARIERLQRQVAELQLQRAVAKEPGDARALILQQILALTEIDPEGSPQSFADALSVPLRSIQRYVASLVRSGDLIRRNGGWQTARAA